MLISRRLSGLFHESHTDNLHCYSVLCWLFM